MKIVADREVCIGAGMCVRTATGLFDQDADDGCVIVLKTQVEGMEADLARRAVSNCPSGALSIVEDTWPAAPRGGSGRVRRPLQQ